MSQDPDNIQYFAKQRHIYPREVSEGLYRRLKWLAMVLLLGVYYGVPWIRWDRGEHAPDQAILIDMPMRKAYFFNIELWADEVYFFAGIMIMAAVGLFFVTSLFGRVWCGYACPQTVWTDLFVKVERWIEGDRNAHIRLDASPMSFEKLWKKTLTHFLWLVISLVTGGAWVFYFVDAPTLMENIRHLHLSWMQGSWIFGLTLSTYIMAGFAREQVCIYMCPYSRFQSAMFDRDTLIIGYDSGRGEPRGKHKQGDTWEGRGHCIDCGLCVQVCPMGIDIRNGLQMECIACGLCVDACNSVMDKVGLPHGLIRYDTQNNVDLRSLCRKKGESFKDHLHILRPRTVYYTLILCLLSGMMLYGFLSRAKTELHVLHDRNPLFVKLSDGSIRNTYTVKILNKTHEDRVFALNVNGVTPKEIKVQAATELDAGHLPVFADSMAQFRIMIVTDVPSEPRLEISFDIKDEQNELKAEHESVFISGADR